MTFDGGGTNSVIQTSGTFGRTFTEAGTLTGLISYTRRGLIVVNRQALQDLLDSVGGA